MRLAALSLASLLMMAHPMAAETVQLYAAGSLKAALTEVARPSSERTAVRSKRNSAPRGCCTRTSLPGPLRTFSRPPIPSILKRWQVPAKVVR